MAAKLDLIEAALAGFIREFPATACPHRPNLVSLFSFPA